MPLRSHISVLKEYTGSYGAYYIQDLAVLSYLNITLPCQSLSPDAEMGREALVNRVQSLADKLGASPSTSVESLKNDAAVDEELYDDVANTMNSPIESSEGSKTNRQSCYVEMNHPDTGALDAADGKNSVATPPQTEDNEIPESQEEALAEDLNYEIPAPEKSDVVELLEEEEYDDVAHFTATEDLGFELTEEALVEKLKKLESTSSKNILYGSLFSGWLLKQKKKKIMSKWHKRYCILREQFLFYYQSESDLKSLGVIVLPGYVISEEKSSSKDKFVFKLVPSGKGRSTYLFQLASKPDYDAWLSVLHGICSQKLNRLSSDAFNRVAKRMDEENEDGSAGGSTKSREKPILEEELYDDCVEGGTDQIDQQQGEGEDLYEIVGFAPQSSDITPRTMQSSLPPPIPSPALSPRHPSNIQRLPDNALYDDHVDHIDAMAQQSAVVPAEDLYEGIPGEDYEPEGGHPPPIQEDLYEDIAPFQQSIASPIPPRPPTSLPPPIDAAPSLPPARSSNIPERRPVGQGNDSIQPPPLPPPMPGRGERQKESNAEIKQDKPDVPAEDEYSYENVYIGTKPYVAKEEDELAFNRGDLIYILQKVNSNWWIGCMDKKVGLVPSDLLIAGFAH